MYTAEDMQAITDELKQKEEEPEVAEAEEEVPAEEPAAEEAEEPKAEEPEPKKEPEEPQGVLDLDPAINLIDDEEKAE